MEKHGLEINESFVRKIELSTMEGYMTMKDML